MAKLVLDNGLTIEGTVEELIEFGEKLSDGEVVDFTFRKVKWRKPKAGDYVKFSEDYVEDDVDLTAGKYFEIISVEYGGDIIEFYDDEGDERAQDSDSPGIEIYEKVASDQLKVGDYVVPLPSADGEYELTNTNMRLGKIVEGEVDPVDGIYIEIVVHKDNEEVGERFLVNSKHFRKATDEEIARAKRDAVFAKLGRKPNEFKQGDIVRLVENSGAHVKGVIVEIAVDGAKFYCDEENLKYGSEPSWFELVAPVESRVDV